MLERSATRYGHGYVIVDPVRTANLLDTARDMLVNPDPGLPPLDSVVRTPTFGKDATLITAPGYHRADALWMFRDDSLTLPEVPTAPTCEQVAHARALLVDELLVDFPFVRDSDRAHAVAAVLLLQPVAILTHEVDVRQRVADGVGDRAKHRIDERRHPVVHPQSVAPPLPHWANWPETTASALPRRACAT